MNTVLNAMDNGYSVVGVLFGTYALVAITAGGILLISILNRRYDRSRRRD